MNTNFKWHYSGNMENMVSELRRVSSSALKKFFQNPQQPPTRFAYHQPMNQPQHHHPQYQHYPQIQPSLNYQAPPQNIPQHHPHVHHGVHQTMPEHPNNFYQPQPHNITDQYARHPQQINQEQHRQQQIQMQPAPFYSQQQRMQK